MMILMVIPLSSLRCADWLIGTVPRSLGRQNSQPGPESLVLMTCQISSWGSGSCVKQRSNNDAICSFFGRVGTFLGGLGCVELDAGLVMHLRAGEAGGEYCQYVEILDLCSHHLCLLNTHNIKDYKRAHVSTDACIVYGRWGWLTAINPWR